MPLVKFDFNGFGEKPNKPVSFICFCKDSVNLFDENWRLIGTQPRRDSGHSSEYPKKALKKEDVPSL